MANPEGISVTYQGYVCSPLFEFQRSAGLEPDFGFVFVERKDLGAFQVRESLAGLDSIRATTQGKGTQQGLLSAGRLIVSETLDGKTFDPVTIENVLVSERACEVPFQTEDGSDLVRVEITDIRYLWKTRGLLFAWVNVPQGIPGVTNPVPFVPQKTVARNIPAPAPGSMRGNKTPWTVRQVLEELILPALPGAPKAGRFPPKGSTDPCRPHVWAGVLPKEALADILRETGWILSLDLAGTVSFWGEGEGAFQDANGKVIPLGKIGGISGQTPDERVSEVRGLIGFHYVPSCVVVIGPPIYENIRMELEPVGEVGGSILPLADALDAIGIPDQPFAPTTAPVVQLRVGPTPTPQPALARRFPFLEHHERSQLVFESSIGEFQRWAFKWFRLRGLPGQNADKLPMLMRASVDAIGQFQNSRVWCESFTVINVMGQVIDNASKTATTSVVSQLAVAKLVSGLKAQKLDAFRAVANLPFQEQSQGWEIDPARGLVMFDFPVGSVSLDGAPLAEAFLNPGDGHAIIEFGFTHKPSQNDPLQLQHRYFSVWTRTKEGAQSKLDQASIVSGIELSDLTQAATLVPSLCPLAIFRPEMQQVIDVNGTTNKAFLDTQAKALALDAMKRPQATSGAVVEFCRPTPVATTGKTLSVRWSSGLDGVPHTVAHIGAFAPLSPFPDPGLRTRAFGEQSATVETTFTPTF